MNTDTFPKIRNGMHRQSDIAADRCLQALHCPGSVPTVSRSRWPGGPAADWLDLGTWQILACPDALATAAEMLRKGERSSLPRAPRSRVCWDQIQQAEALAKELWPDVLKGSYMKAEAKSCEGFLEALMVYGANAPEVIRRQLQTIDPDDYHGPNVRRWQRMDTLFRQLNQTQTEAQTETTP